MVLYVYVREFGNPLLSTWRSDTLNFYGIKLDTMWQFSGITGTVISGRSDFLVRSEIWDLPYVNRPTLYWAWLLWEILGLNAKNSAYYIKLIWKTHEKYSPLNYPASWLPKSNLHCKYPEFLSWCTTLSEHFNNLRRKHHDLA